MKLEILIKIRKIQQESFKKREASRRNFLKIIIWTEKVANGILKVIM